MQLFNIVKLDEARTRHEGNEWRAIFRLTRSRERSECAAVKRIIHGQNAPFRFTAILVIGLRKSTGKFQRSFPRLSAAVAKEGAVEAGDFGQKPRQLALILMKEKIRNVNQSASLAFDCRLNNRMIVAKRVDSDSAQEIEIALALGIPEIHAAPTHKKDRLALIRRKQELRFHAGN